MNPVWYFLNGVPQIGTLRVTSSQIMVGDGSASAPSYSFTNDPDTGFYSTASVIRAAADGAAIGAWSQTALIANAIFLSNASQDVLLNREGAGHFFQRNSTNAQRASWANTYTSSTNYEAFSVDWQTAANVATVGTRTAATGTGRPLKLVAQASSAGAFAGSLQLDTDGTVTLDGATATPAGGATTLRLVFGSTAGFGIYIGSGAPTVSAAQGSIYLRSNGTTTNDRCYINTNGTTGWTAITTAA